MPTVLITPNRTVMVEDQVPRRGRVRIKVEANRMISILVTDAEGWEDYQRGFPVNAIASAANRVQWEEDVRFNYRGPWYLLLVNRSPDEYRAVHYEVYY